MQKHLYNLVSCLSEVRVASRKRAYFKVLMSFRGRLPGDSVIDRGDFRFYLPIATSILLELAVVGFNLFIRRTP